MHKVLNSHKALDGMLADFCDGEQFKSSPLFKDDPCALQIQLYYDELEVCNPLGSKAKKHKLGKINMFLSTIIRQFSLYISTNCVSAIKFCLNINYNL